ncbi:MAG: histidinol-phosphate transaminase [Omnitrophica bacterium RIFCSPHIGHO2_02_FULL_63_14]|nr:MAG: histidinol-phosphate transaminase [Omnitrophica bacterium RIFCSPHIGHO2_02_FULL_63_14]
MKPHLAAVKNYQPGKPIEELEREYGVRNAVKLASNENALGPSPRAVRAMRAALGCVNRYPDSGCFRLRQKLAGKLRVPPGWIVFGNGSDELLVMAMRAFAGAGDRVVIADPTFLIYEIAAQAENASVVKVPIRGFRYDLEGMRSAIDGATKLVFIANPDNPVGTYVRRAALEEFMAAVPSGVTVVLDEAYHEFAAAKKDYPDALALLKRYANLIVTRTFSKAYGLSGLRIGYALAQGPVASALAKVREPFNVNLLAQVAAEAALDDRAHLQKTLRMTRAGLSYLNRELEKLGLKVIETATNFALCDLGRDAGAVYEALLRRGVIIRPMAAWGLPTFIRVTVGMPAENKKFIEALKQIL